jgi:hypothetical protein
MKSEMADSVWTLFGSSHGELPTHLTMILLWVKIPTADVPHPGNEVK